MRGHPGPIMVLIGPDPVGVETGRFEFLRRTVPGTPVEIWRERKYCVNIIHDYHTGLFLF
jgi:hypothetical protein